MGVLGIVALVFFSALAAWCSAIFFIRFGFSLAGRCDREVRFAPPQAIQADGFIQRFPGQLPGDVEELPNNVTYAKGWIR